MPEFFANAIELCPVPSLDACLEASGIESGAIFRALGRHDRLGDRLADAAVAARVKQYAKLAGFDLDDFAAHSLRRG